MQTRPLRAESFLLLLMLTPLAACGGGGDGSASSGALRTTLSPTAVSLERATTAGIVAGVDNSATTGTYEWLGVPYAKPPVGSLRWMPPVAPDAWSGVRPARQFGASCAQGGRFFSPAPDNAPFGLSVRDGLGKPVGSEDCLTLNIWRPANTTEKLPVIVFIHGGSNVSGYTADPLYNGQVLATKAQAVVVTLNYRLGLFGWLNLPQLKTGNALADSGNFATLDQIQALKFVKANIEAFGGDADNVTVMGQSAGSVNVWALLVSPLTEGLIHKAIPLSGALLTVPPAQALVYGNNLLTALLIADGKAIDPITAQLYLLTHTPAQIASYLRGKTADELIQVSFDPNLGSAPAVIADGAVVPAVPAAAIALGAYRNIPVLSGTTLEEGKLFGALVGAYTSNDYDRFTQQYHFDPDAAPTLTEGDLLTSLYLPVDKPVLGWNTVTAVLTDATFVTANAASMSTLALRQPGKLWYYRFDWNEEPAPFDTVYGAVHGIDIPFLFGSFDRKSVFSFAFSTANKPGREALSDAMIATVSAFARTGNPNNPALGTHWPNWPATLVFDASATQARISVK
ncbi:hypothetical protein MEBOL_007695 [Melittangium boletus DSM 14713]|uniref:Carboxylic ester hydrolase n=1 Tax=Melittangium boletus DSM 14713 TaxID=1294270 RepID=A0A250IR40_9BACT|nr:hypothetical protein MEBOL_007695 [Melittangium boletus DSM 14713]